MNELILKVKDQVIQNMIEHNVLASIQLAYLIANENKENTNTDELLEDVITKDSLKGITDYKEACRRLSSSNKECKRFIYIIESNKLFEFDYKAEDKKEEVSGDSIELNIGDNQPVIEVYTVRKSADSEILFTSNSLEEAKEHCKSEYSIFNSKSRVIFTNTDEESIKEPPSKIKRALVTGTPVELDNAPVYVTKYSKEHFKRLTGVFYVNTDGVYLNRVKVSQSMKDCQNKKKYIGYIDIKNIK